MLTLTSTMSYWRVQLAQSLLIVTVYLAKYFSRKSDKHLLIVEFWSWIFLFSFLFFPSASTSVFQTFNCDDDFDSGSSYLKAGYRLECDGSNYDGYLGYALLMMLIYPIGIYLFISPFYSQFAKDWMLLLIQLWNHLLMLWNHQLFTACTDAWRITPLHQEWSNKDREITNWQQFNSSKRFADVCRMNMQDGRLLYNMPHYLRLTYLRCGILNAWDGWVWLVCWYFCIRERTSRCGWRC